MARRYRYYEILGVGKEATPGEIKQAYRRLAKEDHPDKNPNPQAHEKFVRINVAYAVLSNPARRARYDSSPEECPDCGTDEVIQTVETLWRCRSCGCKFDSSGMAAPVRETERATIPERRQKFVELFKTTQCSWCKKFYTQEPFICPFGRLQSNCIYFTKLDERDRERFLKEDKWWWRMQDMLLHVQEKGTMAKCTKCFSLNPNPQGKVCWKCGHLLLRCPKHDIVFVYNIDNGTWKCQAQGCPYRVSPQGKVVWGVVSKRPRRPRTDVHPCRKRASRISGRTILLVVSIIVGVLALVMAVILSI